ncbi:MAG: hypothetical protein FWC57_02515 [Endomicrobia bacterium]|nr:hypothetical protein [Endomicrobiia bacterium]
MAHIYFNCASNGDIGCAVLCCAVLCCAVLCCAVLCCAVLCCACSLYYGFPTPQKIHSCNMKHFIFPICVSKNIKRSAGGALKNSQKPQIN